MQWWNAELKATAFQGGVRKIFTPICTFSYAMQYAFRYGRRWTFRETPVDDTHKSKREVYKDSSIAHKLMCILQAPEVQNSVAARFALWIHDG